MRFRPAPSAPRPSSWITGRGGEGVEGKGDEERGGMGEKGKGEEEEGKEGRKETPNKKFGYQLGQLETFLFSKLFLV